MKVNFMKRGTLFQTSKVLCAWKYILCEKYVYVFLRIVVALSELVGLVPAVHGDKVHLTSKGFLVFKIRCTH